MSSSRYHELTISQIIDETADARSLVFRLPSELKPLYQYQPGQFITLQIPFQGKLLSRCYSMSSAPRLDDELKITVKRVTDGRASNFICGDVKVGDTLSVMRPAGIFVPPSLNMDLLLCAGGSGITPMLSILRTALDEGAGRIRLLYANRDENSVIFKQELQHLSREYPDRLEVIHLLDSVQGIPSVTLLARLAQPFIGQINLGGCFICGPAPYITAMGSALSMLGLHSDKIYIEKFVSLPDQPPMKSAVTETSVANRDATVERDDEIADVADVADVANVADVIEVEQANVTLELDGQTHEFVWDGQDTLLDAAEKIGLELPHSCRAGMCASCMCEVKQGKVKLLANDVLSERDLSQSLTLSCQAVPLTDKVHIRYT